MTVESTLVYISIIILVVIELSGKVEESNLRLIAGQSSGGLVMLPNLGRFSLIHMFNTLLIFVSYFILFGEFLNGSPIIVPVLLFVLIWLMAMLPLLETDIYRNSIQKGSFPKSIVAHFWYTVVSTVIFPIIMVIVAIVYPTIYYDQIFGIVFAILWLLGAVLYLYLFEEEISSRDI